MGKDSDVLSRGISDRLAGVAVSCLPCATSRGALGKLASDVITTALFRAGHRALVRRALRFRVSHESL